jgi:arginase
MKQHLNFFFPQWQGSGQDMAPYCGAQELKNVYLRNIQYAEVAVSAEPLGELKNNIHGYDAIVRQLSEANELLITKKLDSIFTIGAGCDADITSIAYLNRRLRDKFAVVWFDAHGDINNPVSSGTKLFYGMPIRFLLEDHDTTINAILDTKLETERLFLLGARDLDEPEKVFIRDQNIAYFDVHKIEQNFEMILQEIKRKGYDKIYIHIDLDVLDPVQFPYIAVPVSQGLQVQTLHAALNRFVAEFTIIGMGLFEYVPSINVDTSNPFKTKCLDLLNKIMKTGLEI